MTAEMAEVWCASCDQASTRTTRVRGENLAYCDRHGPTWAAKRCDLCGHVHTFPHRYRTDLIAKTCSCCEACRMAALAARVAPPTESELRAMGGDR